MSVHITDGEYKIVQQTIYSILPASAKVYIFGSRTRETCKPFSDLDLAIDLGRPMSVKEKMELNDAFDESCLVFKVDILDLYSTSYSFKQNIEQDLFLLAKDGMLA